MKYQVEIPFAGYVYVEVEADSKDAAIDAAMEGAGSGKITFENDAVEVMEWDLMRHVVQGNVCYAPIAKARADEMKDENVA